MQINPQKWILNTYLILCKYGTDQCSKNQHHDSIDRPKPSLVVLSPHPTRHSGGSSWVHGHIFLDGFMCFQGSKLKIGGLEGKRRKKACLKHLRRWRVSCACHPSMGALIGMVRFPFSAFSTPSLVFYLKFEHGGAGAGSTEARISPPWSRRQTVGRSRFKHIYG